MAKRLTKALAIVLAALCILSTSIFSFAAATDAQLMAKAVDAINSTYGTSYTVKGVRFSQIGRPEVEEDPGPNYGRLLYEVEFSVKDGNTYYDCDVENRRRHRRCCEGCQGDR